MPYSTCLLLALTTLPEFTKPEDADDPAPDLPEVMAPLLERLRVLVEHFLQQRVTPLLRPSGSAHRCRSPPEPLRRPQQTGIRFSDDQLRRILHQEGFSFQRPKHTMKGKRDEVAYQRAQRQLKTLKKKRSPTMPTPS